MRLTESQESDENYYQSNGERGMLNSADERTSETSVPIRVTNAPLYL